MCGIAGAIAPPHRVDEEALRPYLEADRVVKGMFETVSRIYGVTVEPREKIPAWDASVKSYAIKERDGSLLATFYTDPYPRENPPCITMRTPRSLKCITP